MKEKMMDIDAMRLALQQKALKAYHGTPHKFAPTERNPLGEFDPSKMGMGEGQQAYGYGHYLAEAPEVAKSYRQQAGIAGPMDQFLMSKRAENALQNLAERASKKKNRLAAGVYEELMAGDFSPDILRKKISSNLYLEPEEIDQSLKALKRAEKVFAANKGHLYHIELPQEHVDQMLDWDNPLDASTIKKLNNLKIPEYALKKMNANNAEDLVYMHSDKTGEEFYTLLSEMLDSWKVPNPDKLASLALKKAGIPGIKYLDQQSRDNNQGSRNFVIFPGNEHLMKIVHREKKGGIVHKAHGGAMPTLAQMKLALKGNQIKFVGANEAPNIQPKPHIRVDYMGGPGGVDMSPMPGQQLLPQSLQQQGQQEPQGPQGMPQGQQGAQGMPQGPEGAPEMGQMPSQPGMPQMPQMPQANTNPISSGSNILSLTPQGQALSALKPQGMAGGGQPENEFHQYDSSNPSISSLAKAFDDAISHYLSQPVERQRELSMMAADRVGNIIGRVGSGPRRGQSKDLLGKNAKLIKSEKGKGTSEPLKLHDGRGVETTGLALSPAYEEGKFNTCPNHHSCKEECLGKTSGNYFKLGGGPDLTAFKGPRLNSLMKTQAFLRDPHAFAIKLFDEIQAAKDIAAANGNHLGLRLNVLSDINPRVHKSIIENHPDVTFYDYTKNNTNPIADNHHYTYSSTGVSQTGVENPHTNWKQMRRRLDTGSNVAMAFTHKRHLPKTVFDEETGKTYRVIDGDTHDFRPDDMVDEGEDGVIIGLRNKKATGKMNEAHLDSNGFFVYYDPQEKMVPNAKGKMIYAKDKNKMTVPTNHEVRIKPQSRTIQIMTNDGEPQ